MIKEAMRFCAAAFVSVFLLSLAAPPCGAAPESAPVTLGLAAKDFPLVGDWVFRSEQNRTLLYASPTGVKYPPGAAIVIPRAGRYRLWVAARDFAKQRPGTRTFSVRIGARHVEAVFGKSGKDNYQFEDGGWVDLAQGPTLIALENARPFARFQGLVLTQDERLTPLKPVTAANYPPARLQPLKIPPRPGATAADFKIDAGDPVATLANDRVRYEFLPAHRGPLATLAIAVKLKSQGQWRAIDIDPAAEGYFVGTASVHAGLDYAGFYPVWTRANVDPFTVEVGGVSVATILARSTYSLADAGERTQFYPRSAEVNGNEARLAFHPSPAGQLSAVWRLAPGQSFADVELNFVPAAAGQATLSYEMFFRRDLSHVAELLSPMMYQRKRLPADDVTLLSNVATTPLTLVQPAGNWATSLALVADPRDIAYQWPDGQHPVYGFSIRGPGATVQPAIYGPVLGTPDAVASKDKPLRLRFKILAQDGDWYAAFRTSVDQIFGVRDYRQNVRTSLSDAVLNMIDLFMDDDHGGWWERAKAPYQIESKNGSTQPTPLLPLSLYRLSDDRRMLDRRVLPTLAFMLSRDGPHFSPVPEDSGDYSLGSMNGPVKQYGISTYAGLWELTAHRTPALLDIASPADGPRLTPGSSHASMFDEYAGRYQLTHDPKDLAKACELADAYIKSSITSAPTRDLGPQPFFFISFVPDWEGLLHLYELTGKQAYLDAAAFGARQLMTGLWSQPAIPPGEIAIHPTGQFGDHPPLMWWKGPEQFRLGMPRQPNDTPAHDVPAWTVSNVGLGFEQPITFRSSSAGRVIWQMGWSAHFLRLYRYTRDQAFLTCARNAVVGRWGNYPGYYVTGFTDLPQNPSYPLTGPDVTDFYYHHVGPHLAWSIDYLVSEAEMLSDGAISFPALRQYGYAYFDSRIFGHAPGKVYDDDAAWLLFRRGVVSVDNVQINTLLAWSEKKLHVILTNQSQQPQDVTLQAGPGMQIEPGADPQATVRIGAAPPAPLAVQRDPLRMKIRLPARGLAAVTLTGVKVAPPARPQWAANRPASAPLTLASEAAPTHAAALALEPGAWHAYVWSSASPKRARSASLHYQLDGQWHQIIKPEYPFEFIVPVPEEAQTLRFKLELKRSDGRTVTSEEGVLTINATR